jgi:hypothetical protein
MTSMTSHLFWALVLVQMALWAFDTICSRIMISAASITRTSSSVLTMSGWRKSFMHYGRSPTAYAHLRAIVRYALAPYFSLQQKAIICQGARRQKIARFLTDRQR